MVHDIYPAVVFLWILIRQSDKYLVLLRTATFRPPTWTALAGTY